MLQMWIKETPEADRLVVAVVDAGVEATGGKMLASVSASCCICADTCFVLVVANAVFVLL